MFKKLAAAAAIITMSAIAVAASACSAEATPTQPETQPTFTEPTTIEGFRALWNSINPNIWAGGDVSDSIQLDDGRSVFIYGDTLSYKNGFVNSTAIVYNPKSGLKVSNQGKQVLPPGGYDAEGRKIVYWAETITGQWNNLVNVTVAPMSIGTDNSFDFRRHTAHSKTAVLHVTEDNNVNFLGWGPDVPEPQVSKEFLGIWQGVPEHELADPNSIFYRKEAHPQFKLANGKTVYTICQNRLDGDLSDLSEYAPIWIEE